MQNLSPDTNPLRVHIATSVLPTVIADPMANNTKDAAEYLGIPLEEYNPFIHFPKVAAKQAVDFADALLAELSKPPTK